MIEERITSEEREKCAKVAEAFEEFMRETNFMCVSDAGPFGYIILRYFNRNQFDGNEICTDSVELFESIWEEWLEHYLLEPVKGTPLSDLSYGELYAMLPDEKKEEFSRKKREFVKAAGLETELRLA